MQNYIDNADLLVGFNIKFDLHWLQRMGINFKGKKVWDCQLAHFLLMAQRTPFPSLDGVCAHYGLEGKDPTVERDYWSKGIDTPDIPQDVILHYLAIDCLRTKQVYEKQLEEFKQNSKLYTLFKLDCADLLVLQEMEYNGLKLNVALTEVNLKECEVKLEELEKKLRNRYPTVPVNWDSPDHVSTYLYGGTIRVDRKELAGFYKTGVKTGQPRYKHVEDVFELPRLVEPVEGSELKKEGYFGTGDAILRQLKKPPSEVELLLERAKLTKLMDYYKKLPELLITKDWENDTLHGQFNQTVARTGRLSSSDPNEQNFPDQVNQLIVSRYDLG